MYVLVKAIGVKKTQGARYGDVNVNDVPFYQLFNIYRKLYITLSNVFLADPVSVELSIFREKYSAFQGTFTDLLVDLADSYIEQTTVSPVLDPKYATYSDAFRAGYKIEQINLDAAINSNLPPSSKTSLRISRPKPITDMGLFFNNCIASINGFFHRTDYDGEYAYIIDGNSSQIKSHQNQIGFLSFLNIGKIENVPITPDMLFKQTNESGYKNKVYVKLGKDITNKSIILILGGYLMFVDNKSLKQSGNDVFMIDINNVPFIERFFEAMPYLNYSSLGLPVNVANPTATNIEQLMSDEVLTKYFTMPQSFFCIIDTPEIFTNKIAVKSSGLPGMFIGYQEPKYPLIVSNGRVAEYWKTFEDGQWAINVHDSYLYNRVFSTVPEVGLKVVGDSNVPATRATNSSGYLLEIGKDF